MKKLFISIALLALASGALSAQERKLPAPDMDREAAGIMDALNARRSVREYSSRDLSEQEIADLLWA
ncbi:MAG: SagB/ThcOx family dehydrogenase, partial [Bacteroidales bacterium]|nr:SagB/ThcOx family dehydrogenase [Bacteroidales bacterium]